MANELQFIHDTTAKTLYFVLRDTSGQMWNTAGTPNWEARTVANWGDYDIALSETPASSFLYVGTIPAISGNMTAGWYWADIYEQAGASPAIADDTLVGQMLGYWDGTTFHVDTRLTGDAFSRLGAPAGASVSADIAAVKSDTGSLVTRITSTLFDGITSLAKWLRLLARKDAGDATAKSELNTGGGAYDETTDSAEALRDRGDAAYLTATGFAVAGDAMTLTGDQITALVTAIVAGVEAEIADDTTGEAVKQAIIDKLLENLPDLDDLSLNAIAETVWNRLTSALTTEGSIGKLLVDRIDAAVSSRLPTASYTSPPSVSQIRTEMETAEGKVASIETEVNKIPRTGETHTWTNVDTSAAATVTITEGGA